MAGSDETRIVLLGKTGAGKSSLGNTILGERLLKTKMSPNPVTGECQAQSKVINGVRTTVIDTPGFFDTNKDEKKLMSEILQSVKRWLPGPHAFLIILKVDRYSEQERDVINKILTYFSEEALKHAVVVFTHGDQLSDGDTIKGFVDENDDLKKLVEKCGGRCHVVDNRLWNNDQSDDSRNNKFQVAQLLNTIETMKQTQGFYSNEFLKKIEMDKSGNVCNILTGVAVGGVLGAVFGSDLNSNLAALIGGTAGILVGAAVGNCSETPQEAAVETVKTVYTIAKPTTEMYKYAKFQIQKNK